MSLTDESPMDFDALETTPEHIDEGPECPLGAVPWHQRPAPDQQYCSDDLNATSTSTGMASSPDRMNKRSMWSPSMLLPSMPSPPDTSCPSLVDVASAGVSEPTDDPWSLVEQFDTFGAAQQDIVASFDFPDESHLQVLELRLLRACMDIAKSLCIDQIIWSLEATSPFPDATSALWTFDHLPACIRPTRTQKTVPHHPIFDMLPWPSVRDKLILVFSQPLELRPIQCASPTALIDLAYDIEDSAEGVRVWGEDPYVAKNWEIGEKVFQNWWWAFDTTVIQQSNVLRKRRGAPVLGQGLVIGEVI